MPIFVLPHKPGKAAEDSRQDRAGWLGTPCCVYLEQSLPGWGCLPQLTHPTKPVSLPPPQVCLYQGRTHREYSLVCYAHILRITEWQEAKLVGCCWYSCLLIRCFRPGSDHGGYYSSPPPTATECGKDNSASPLSPPSGAGKFSPVAFTWEMSQSWPGAADQI